MDDDEEATKVLGSSLAGIVQSMRKQCVPGFFLPAHARETENKAKFTKAVRSYKLAAECSALPLWCSYKPCSLLREETVPAVHMVNS